MTLGHVLVTMFQVRWLNLGQTNLAVDAEEESEGAHVHKTESPYHDERPRVPPAHHRPAKLSCRNLSHLTTPDFIKYAPK